MRGGGREERQQQQSISYTAYRRLPTDIMGDQTCVWGACKKTPYFSQDEGGEPQFCSTHKEDQHWDVRKKT